MWRTHLIVWLYDFHLQKYSLLVGSYIKKEIIKNLHFSGFNQNESDEDSTKNSSPPRNDPAFSCFYLIVLLFSINSAHTVPHPLEPAPFNPTVSLCNSSSRVWVQGNGTEFCLDWLEAKYLCRGPNKNRLGRFIYVRCEQKTPKWRSVNIFNNKTL